MKRLVLLAAFATTFPLSLNADNRESDAHVDSSSKRSEAAFNSGLDSLSDLANHFQQTGTAGAKDMRGILQFSTATLREMQALTSKEDQALEAAGWPRVLDPKRIRSDAGCGDSRALIELANLSTDRRSVVFHEAIKALSRHISSSQLNAELKVKMLAENRRANSRALELGQSQFSLEREIIATTAEALDVLCNQEAWVIEGDSISFYADSDLNRYNVTMERLDGIHVRLGDVMAKMADRAEAASGSLKGLAEEAVTSD